MTALLLSHSLRASERTFRPRSDTTSVTAIPTLFGTDWIRLKSAPPSPSSATALSVVDLFCGCGGMSLGVREAARAWGLRSDVLLAIDLAPAPLQVFTKNFSVPKGRARTEDVAQLFGGQLGSSHTVGESTLASACPSVDVLLAGPPCQGHSDLNNHTRRRDPRNALYLRAVRGIEVMTPRLAIIENVPAVQRDEHGVLDEAIQWLTALRYNVTTALVDCSHLGLAQRRRRHILVAARDVKVSLAPLTSIPVDGACQTIYDYIGDIEDECVTRIAPFYTPSSVTPNNKSRIEHLFKNDLYDLPDTLRPSCHRDKKHTYRAMYGRLRWTGVAQTITSGFGSMGQGRFVHPSRRRTLTPHEAARLQGFPDFYRFTSIASKRDLQHMIGNAVPPVLAGSVVDCWLRTILCAIKAT